MGSCSIDDKGLDAVLNDCPVGQQDLEMSRFRDICIVWFSNARSMQVVHAEVREMQFKLWTCVQLSFLVFSLEFCNFLLTGMQNSFLFFSLLYNSVLYLSRKTKQDTEDLVAAENFYLLKNMCFYVGCSTSCCILVSFVLEKFKKQSL